LLTLGASSTGGKDNGARAQVIMCQLTDEPRIKIYSQVPSKSCPFPSGVTVFH